jgi:hypothetical protein
LLDLLIGFSVDDEHGDAGGLPAVDLAADVVEVTDDAAAIPDELLDGLVLLAAAKQLRDVVRRKTSAWKLVSSAPMPPR